MGLFINFQGFILEFYKLKLIQFFAQNALKVFFSLFIFISFPVSANPFTVAPLTVTDPCTMVEREGKLKIANPAECRRQKDQQRAEEDRENKRVEEDRELEAQERAVEAQRAEEDRIMKQVKEAEAAAAQQEKDWTSRETELKEKCEQAEKDLYAKLDEKKDMVRSSEDDFYSIETQISQAQQELTEDDIKLSNERDRLRRNSNKAIQELKDGLKGEMDGRIEGQIRQMEAGVDQLSEAASQVQEAEMDLFNAKIRAKNEAYAGCYEIAIQETTKKRDEFIAKARTGRLRRRTMDGLIGGGKNQTLKNFNAYFQQAIHRCLNNQAQVLKTQDIQREIKTKEEKLKLKKAQIKKRQDKLEAQIKELNTDKRLEVLTTFKEKMEEVVKEFEIAFERLSKTAASRREHALAKINSLKQKQARILARKEEEMDMDSRFRAKVTECQQEQALNLFKTNQERQQAWLKQRQQNQQRIFQQRRGLTNDYLKSSSLSGGRGAGSVR